MFMKIITKEIEIFFPIKFQINSHVFCNSYIKISNFTTSNYNICANFSSSK